MGSCMTIQLSPEQERVIGQAMRAGLINSPDEVAELGIAAIQSRLSLRHAALNAEQTEEWFRDLTAWSQGHSTSTPLMTEDDLDRDSIYGTRGI
ncbi:MAG: hypothetical protein ACRD25_08900 [Terracidiphilus sp.]